MVRVEHVDAQDALMEEKHDEIGVGDKGKAPAQASWRPMTFSMGFLAMMNAITIGLIVTIVLLLWISNRDAGLLFAQNVNKLPLARSFSHLYLPTIISVLYGLLWAWIDLDIKRLEPYFQLSKTGGADGARSLLLAYPLEFLLTLPFLAYKHRHWPVFFGSVLMMLVLWGLTPTQAGIFATRTIAVRNEVSGYRSEAFVSVAEQGNLSAIYAQSVYNIAWLNETLPPLMTKEYVLGAFSPLITRHIDSGNITYSGQTMSYSVDIACTNVVLWQGELGTYYNSSNGCSFYAPPYRPMGGNDTSKVYDTMYVGYQNQDGIADYYLSSSCGEEFFHAFFIRWSETTPAAIVSGDLTSSPDTSLAKDTSLFCQPSYYRQMVNATISLPNQTVIATFATGDKEALPANMFNTSQFEWMMSAGSEVSVRGEFPTTTFPNQKTHLMDTALNLAYLPKMAPFAIATYQRPFNEYLDAETLRLAYQSAYRLLFARQLVDILQDERTSTQVESTDNELSYVTEAIVVVPGFAYAAIAVLSLVLIISMGLLFTMPGRPSKMVRDPCSVGAVMDMMDRDETITGTFSGLAEADTVSLEKKLATANCALQRPGNDSKSPHFLRVQPNPTDLVDADLFDGAKKTGVRPYEFKAVIGAVFFVLQLAALVIFLVLFVKARREHGLSLPSQSTFVRQLVQNYIPIALATFIEPFWLLLNRLLCLLQPYEQLRRGGASAARSVDLDYSSLPPQFLFWRAARARHWIVFVVCLMVLAANVLSVALSGLMYEDIKNVPRHASFASSRSAKFVALNGTGLPFNTQEAANWQGGTTSDQFYTLMSNLTAGTPLPPWIDEEYAYVAVDTAQVNEGSQIRVNTTAFGAEMQCRPLDHGKNESYSLNIWNDAKFASLDVNISLNGTQVHCTDHESALPLSNSGAFQISDTQVGHVALELATVLVNNRSTADDLFCRQHVLVGWIRADWAFNSSATYRSGSPYGIHNTGRNDTVMLCRPSLQIGKAEVLVDNSGRVQRRLSMNFDNSVLQTHFSTSPWDLVAQVHQFLPDMGGTWHKDAYPSDFNNYLIVQSTNDTTLLDPSLPVPHYELAGRRFSSIYSRLFAILIGSNQNLLLEEDPQPRIVIAQVLTPETRILFSLPAFVVVEGILLCYIIVTIFFYARRPWKVLPRLPSSIASNIAFFAASTAFRELKEYQNTEDARKMRAKWRWGFGGFIGLDGKPHVGIEREPLVSVFREEKPPAYTP